METIRELEKQATERIGTQNIIDLTRRRPEDTNQEGAARLELKRRSHLKLFSAVNS